MYFSSECIEASQWLLIQVLYKGLEVTLNPLYKQMSYGHMEP